MLRRTAAAAAIALVSCLAPLAAEAATVYTRATTAAAAAGDTAVLEVRFIPDGGAYNVVEGSLRIAADPGVLELRELSVAGASPTLWPRKPSWDGRAGTITFTGGAPGEIGPEDALLFRVALLARAAGRITVEPGQVTAYVSDGTGRAEAVSGQSFTLEVAEAGETSRDAWRDLVAADNEPPRIVAVNVGSDPSVYSGLTFISIEATDEQSGLDHLEVAEGANPAVRTGSDYVLQDQSRSVPVTVTAFDRAGNVATFVLPPVSAGFSPWLVAAIAAAAGVAMAALVLATVALRRRRRQ